MRDARMSPRSKDANADPVVLKGRRYTPTLTPASVAVNTVEEQDFTVVGVKAGDKIIGVQNPDFGNATGVVGVRVKADDTIAIRFVNPTAGALVPGAGEWDFLIYTYK